MPRLISTSSWGIDHERGSMGDREARQSVLGAPVFNRLWYAFRDVGKRRIFSGASFHADAPRKLAQSR
jgi:hypothetical protein